MATENLGPFIEHHREEILRRCRAKAGQEPEGASTNGVSGIPQFIDELASALSDDVSKKHEIAERARQHGADRFREGLTIGQVVRDYGAVCQAVTDLAVELEALVSVNEFRTLNRCLDDAIASAVSEFSHRQVLSKNEAHAFDQSLTQSNLLETAINGFEVLMEGNLAIGGATGALVHRCLKAMRTPR